MGAWSRVRLPDDFRDVFEGPRRDADVVLRRVGPW